MNYQFNKFSRIQHGLSVIDLFPSIKGFCACGCGTALIGRKTRFASQECSNSAYIHFAVIKGYSSTIRGQLFNRDKGACRNCGEITKNWHADHIIPVHKGGGACGLSNFQTLCIDCHKEKTILDNKKPEQ